MRQICIKKQLLDNEVSEEYKQAITEHGLEEIEKVPPNCHRWNTAEKAMQTFKNHFKAIFWRCNPMFLVHLWDRPLLQAKFTCNMLH